MRATEKITCLVILAILLVACAPTIQQEETEPAPAPTPVPVEEAENVDLRIEVEEAFLATTLRDQLGQPIDVPGQPGVEILLEEPVFDLVPGGLARVTATVNADAYGIEAVLRPTISLRLSAADGEIQVEVEGVSLGDVQFPLDEIEEQLAEVEATISTQLASALQQVTEATGLRVQDLVVTEQQLIVDLGR